jgi:transposase
VVSTTRGMARLGFVVGQIRAIEEARQKRSEQEPETAPHAMVRLLARVVGLGIETADMLVHEVLSRPMRDRKAVARYAGLTGSPDESGAKRRKQGLARAGNARVRRGMIQLAWRFLLFQKESAPALWYQAPALPIAVRARARLPAARRSGSAPAMISTWQSLENDDAPFSLCRRPVDRRRGDSRGRRDDHLRHIDTKDRRQMPSR